MFPEETSPVVTSFVETELTTGDLIETSETTISLVTTPDVLERIYANTKQSADCLTTIVGVGSVCFIILIASGVYKFFKNIT